MSLECPQGVPDLVKKNIRKGRYFMLRNVKIFRLKISLKIKMPGYIEALIIQGL